MIELGLKGSTSQGQIEDRLKYNPETYEFHLVWEDLIDTSDLIFKIGYVFSSGVKNIILHHPMTDNKGRRVESYVSKEKEPERYENWKNSTLILNDIVEMFKNKGHKIKALVHICYGGKSPTHRDLGYTDKEAQDSLFKNISYMFEKVGGNIFYENGAQKINTLSLHNLRIQRFFIDNFIPVCLDISHLYISTDGSNEILEDTMVALKMNIVHYHIVDSLGVVHDSLSLGKGTIDWKMVKSNLNKYATNIFEIGLKDQLDCTEMIESYNYLKGL